MTDYTYKKGNTVLIKGETPLISNEQMVIIGKCKDIFAEGKEWHLKNTSYAVNQFYETHKHKKNIDFDNCYYGRVGYLGYVVSCDEIVDEICKEEE